MRCSEPASRGFAHPVVGGRPCGFGWRQRLRAGWSYPQGPRQQVPPNQPRSQGPHRPAVRRSSRRCGRADSSSATTSTTPKRSPPSRRRLPPTRPIRPPTGWAAVTWIALLFEQGAITVDDYLGQARATSRVTPSGARGTAFHDALRQALTLSERGSDHPADADAHYQVGAAYGFLASYTATVEGRLLGSLGPARRAYHEHERVLELDPAAQGRRAHRRDVPLRGLRVCRRRCVCWRLSRRVRRRPRARAAPGRRRRALSERRRSRTRSSRSSSSTTARRDTTTRCA